MAWGSGGWGAISWGLTGPPTIIPSSGISPPGGFPTDDGGGHGNDLWWDGDYRVDATGDWLVISGIPALKQSLTRRLLTNPGDWATKPDYGVGAPALVKRRATQSNIDYLVNRTRQQFLLDERVVKVTTISTFYSGTGTLKMAVSVQAKNQVRSSNPIIVQVGLS